MIVCMYVCVHLCVCKHTHSAQLCECMWWQFMPVQVHTVPDQIMQKYSSFIYERIEDSLVCVSCSRACFLTHYEMLRANLNEKKNMKRKF